MFIDRQDILYAFRSARRTPLLTCIVVLALSVGIGLNAGVFTVINYLLLDPPTRKDPSSFVKMYPRYQDSVMGAAGFSSLNTEDYDAIRTQAHSLSEIAAWQLIPTKLEDARHTYTSLLVTCNYFQVFGIDHSLMGRFFLPDECGNGTSAHVAVISEVLWRSSYSSDPHIVGKEIHVNRLPLTIVGVIPNGSTNMLSGSVWIPYTLQPVFNRGINAFHNPSLAWLTVAGRLRSGYSRADATAELQIILHQRDRLYLEQKIFERDRKTSVVLTNGSLAQNPGSEPAVAGLMSLIMGPLCLVLLLACTNVTMLFLSRSIARKGEMAVRLALGAGRARLMRMLTLESFFTALIAGLASIYLAARVPSLLFAVIDPVEGQFTKAIQPDWKVFGYLAVLVLLATAVSAFAPMRESFRFDLVTALKGREGTSTSRSRTTSALIVVQIAMSFVLLAAAVLFVRLPSTITGIDPGFETRHVMTVPLEINMPPYSKESAQTFYRTLQARVSEIPGVQSLAYAGITPFNGSPQEEIRFGTQTKGHGRAAVIDDVSGNFFSTFQIAMLRGHSFSSSDISGTPAAPVAIVSQSFARSFWGDADPMGKVVVTPDNRHLTVIGVARDTRSERFGMLDGPRLYTLRNPDSLQGQLFIRFQGDAAPVSASVEQILKSLDPDQTAVPATIWDFLEQNAVQMQSLAKIVLFMAGIAMLLAITGLYAVLTFAINRRTREFGIQMMLGATRESIFRAVIRKGLGQIVIGLLCGILLAVPASWVFAGMTQKSTLPIHAFDISVYSVSALILLIVAFCAMILPALRATQVDPIQALRNE